MNWTLTDEQADLRARARRLAEDVIAPVAGDVDRAEEYPWKNVAALREAGFTGMTVPKELGGPGTRISTRSSWSRRWRRRAG